MTDSRIITEEDLNKLGEEGIGRIFPDKIKISVQMATCGIAAGADLIYNAIISEVKNKDIIIDKTGCIGYCKREPMLNLYIPGFNPVVYSDLTSKKVQELLPQWLNGNIPEDNALGQLDGGPYETSIKNKIVGNIKSLLDHPFFVKQKKSILRNSGFINPLQISEYVGRGGYYTLFRVLKGISSDEIIQAVKKSGLRGRGGAGFPTGLKWEICKKEKSDIKFIICNADEGDPGAYMDRTVLEGDPFSVLEGMTIGAYAIGVQKGYIYVRKEYPLAVKHLKIAIE
ncbi:MAG: NADH-quinone oxidoreductase subunit J/K, partial [Spirochaetes bacterium]